MNTTPLQIINDVFDQTSWAPDAMDIITIDQKNFIWPTTWINISEWLLSQKKIHLSSDLDGYINIPASITKSHIIINALRDLADQLELSTKEITKKNINQLIEKEKEKKYLKIQQPRQEKSRKPKRGYFYLGFSNKKYKIGISKNIQKRIATYKTENPFGFEIIFQKEVQNMKSCEKEILDFLGRSDMRKEWFQLTPSQIRDVKTIAESWSICQN